MKIFFVARGYPTSGNPLLGNYESVQANAVAAKGQEVIYLCTPKYRSMLHVFDKNRLRMKVRNGVKVYEYSTISLYLFRFDAFKRLSRFFAQKAYDRMFRKVLKKEGEPDIIHIHSLFVACYATNFKRYCDSPIVLTEHWSFLIKSEYADKLKWMAPAYGKADKVIAVSESLASSIRKFADVPITVVNNMVDDVFWKPYPVRRQFDGRFHFVTVGRLHPVKNYEMLINAFADADFGDDTVLDIVGDGDLREDLQSLIIRRHMEGKVLMHGLKRSDEVSEILCQSDCFVLSSSAETFGIVIIEAMSKGLPVIATQCGGPEEFVTESTGIITPNGDCAAFAEAMQRMRKCAGMYDSEAIKRYCHDRFSQTVIAEKIIEVYLSLTR